MEMVHKVTLATKKEVLLRDFKIKHQRLAAQAAGSKAGDNTTAMGVFMIEEILKQLIFQINGQEPDKASLEDLDSVFTYGEYQQLITVVNQLMGVDNAAPLVEIVNSGE